MTSNWQELSIGDIADVIGGGTPSTKISENFSGDIPWLTPKDLSGYSERYISHGERHITQKGLESSSARLLPKDTVLLTSRAPVGYVAIAANPITTNQGFRSLVLKPNFSPAFVYYLLKNNVELLKANATGTTFGELSGSALKRLRFRFPPYDQQVKIAHILGTLDEKIELNRKMNKNLEQIARTIFKSWFVDFDPVRAKAEGKQPFGMDSATAALFPDSFEDSELGEIPRGWEVHSIGDMVETVGGATPSTNEPSFWNGNVCFATPKDMSSLASPVLLSTERHISDGGVARISSGVLPVGTVLLSSRAPIGYLAVTEVPVAVNQGVIAMVCKRNLPNYYVLNWTIQNMETIIGRANGTTFPEISKKNFRPISAIIPPSQILGCFMDVVTPIYKQIILNLKESQTLISLRGALLPKLMSGELPVHTQVK